MQERAVPLRAPERGQDGVEPEVGATHESECVKGLGILAFVPARELDRTLQRGLSRVLGPVFGVEGSISQVVEHDDFDREPALGRARRNR